MRDEPADSGSQWLRVCGLDDLPCARVKIIALADLNIAVFRLVDGRMFAVEDRCPHRFAPLSLGRIEGDDLRCMYHGLRFRSDG